MAGLSLLQDNWLVIVFKLQVGFGGVQIDRLHVLDFPDITILALVGVTVARPLYHPPE